MCSLYRRLYQREHESAESLPDIRSIVDSVKRWFDNHLHFNYLVIFDDADHLSVDEDFCDLSEYLPSAPNVQIIITTRQIDNLELPKATRFYVPPLEPNESIELLCRVAGLDENASTETLTQLVQALQHAPHPITVVGKQIAQTPDLQFNLNLYPQYHQEGVKVCKQQTTTTDQKANLFTTLKLSLDNILKNEPEAAKALFLLIFFGGHNIDSFLFKQNYHIVKEESFGRFGGSSYFSPTGFLGSGEAINQQLPILNDYHLIASAGKNAAYTMHDLCQQWAFDQISKEDRMDYFVSAAETLFEHDRCPNLQSARIFQHAKRMILLLDDCINRASRGDCRISEVLHIIKSLSGICKMNSKSPKLNCCLADISERVLGPVHSETVEIKPRLHPTISLGGQLFAIQGVGTIRCVWFDLVMHLLTKSIARALLGRKTSSSLISTTKRYQGQELANIIANVARIVHSAGHYKIARQLRKQVLDNLEHLFGPGHPDTFLSQEDFAESLLKEGCVSLSARQQYEVFQKMEKHLGANHIDTLRARERYARHLQYLGNYERSVQIRKEVLNAKISCLGDEHPEVVQAQETLVVTFSQMSDHDSAAGLRRSLSDGLKANHGEHNSIHRVIARLLLKVVAQLNKIDELRPIKREH